MLRHFSQVYRRRIRRMPGPLVWIDCEMTGLNHQTDNIIEICCLLTDAKLDLIERNGFERVIHVPKEKLDGMDEWCQTTHSKTGLIQKVLDSTNTAPQVESELLDYLKKHMSQREGILAGNSVHVDRLFLLREFPKVTDFLHYRLIDVSSIKEIGYRHNPMLMEKVPKKSLNHSARSDILESIQELKWYYDNYLTR